MKVSCQRAWLVAVGLLMAVACRNNPAPQAHPSEPGNPDTTQPALTTPAQVPPETVVPTPDHHPVVQDNSPKLGPRVVPTEALIRSHLSIFGGLANLGDGGQALALETALKGTDGNNVFDTWGAYLTTLGLPDYASDIPRSPQVNALMAATFERIGTALCDRAMDHDHPAGASAATSGAVVFNFALPGAPFNSDGGMPPAGFTSRLDKMHKRFLGYPLALAPASREASFFQLYRQTIASHPASGTQFTAEQAGWAVLCYALVRHPEFVTY